MIHILAWNHQDPDAVVALFIPLFPLDVLVRDIENADITKQQTKKK